MHHSQIVQDIHTAVRYAIADNLYLLDEAELVARADLLLATLPIMGNIQPTTERLMHHYHMELHAELCHNHKPRVQAESVEEEVRELTRAIMVVMGGDEGISVEVAAMLGLVLYKHGLAKFCALPASAPPWD